jgi:hypothetical protein
METTADTSSDILSLASWNRERSTEELRTFVAMHHAALPADIDIF